MIMNKKSQFTKIFSQAILDMKDNGRLDIFHGRKSQQNKQSCSLPDPKQKPLGFKKLTFLFIVLVSGIFISVSVVLFEFIAKMFLKKTKSTKFKDWSHDAPRSQISIRVKNKKIQGFLQEIMDIIDI